MPQPNTEAFTCGYCLYETESPIAMMRHIKTYHPESWYSIDKEKDDEPARQSDKSD